MSKLVWITDPHFNFLQTSEVKQFAERVAKTRPSGIVISGDIAEAPNLPDYLYIFAKHTGSVPIYFVLGNHDYYRGSFEGVERVLNGWMAQNGPDKLFWLDHSNVITLDDHVAIVGDTGWFDGVHGDAHRSDVIMSDFEQIRDLRPHFDAGEWTRGEPAARNVMLAKLRELAAASADRLRPKLIEATVKREHVIVVTHFPPFAESSWHGGKPSNKHWLPWFTNSAMGQMLREESCAAPKTKFTVLCGHSHSPGVVRANYNLQVLTGMAEYSFPMIAGILYTDAIWDNVLKNA